MIAMHSKLVMLAKAGDPDAVVDPVMEPKLDGHRMLAFVQKDGVRMYARTGVDKTARLPAIVSALSELPVGTVLDGEVIAPNDTGGDWSGVQHVLGSTSNDGAGLVYVVFDILSLMGEDVRLNPLHVRRGYLEAIEASGVLEGTPVELVKQTPYDAAHVEYLVGRGWEGAIVKARAGTYESGARRWVKVKAVETEDVVVMGATDGKGKYAGLIGALRFGQYEQPDYLVEYGQCSGMDDDWRRTFTTWRATGVLAGTVIEIAHMGKMPSGGWRHPQFKRIRTDKRPEECVT